MTVSIAASKEGISQSEVSWRNSFQCLVVVCSLVLSSLAYNLFLNNRKHFLFFYLEEEFCALAPEVELSLGLRKCSINSLFSAPPWLGTVISSFPVGGIVSGGPLIGWQREQSLVSLTPEGTCLGSCCSQDSQKSTHLIHAATFLSVIPCALDSDFSYHWLQGELHVSKLFSHPNILPYRATFIADNELWVVTPFMAYGE